MIDTQIVHKKLVLKMMYHYMIGQQLKLYQLLAVSPHSLL